MPRRPPSPAPPVPTMPDPMGALVERLAIKMCARQVDADDQTDDDIWAVQREHVRVGIRNEVRLILSDIGPDWALVPVEPGDVACLAGARSISDTLHLPNFGGRAYRVWRAMIDALAARPQQPPADGGRHG